MIDTGYNHLTVLVHWSGLLKMYLPATTFIKCAAAKPPLNTLFVDIDSNKISYVNLEDYLDLMLALYDLSPEGS